MNLVKMEKSGHLSPFLTVLGRVFGALRYSRPFWPKFKNRKFPKWLFLAIFAVSRHFGPFLAKFFFAFSKTPILAIFEQFENCKKAKSGHFGQISNLENSVFPQKIQKKANFFQGQARLGLAIFEVRLGLSKPQVRLGLDYSELRLG